MFFTLFLLRSAHGMDLGEIKDLFNKNGIKLDQDAISKEIKSLINQLADAKTKILPLIQELTTKFELSPTVEELQTSYNAVSKLMSNKTALVDILTPEMSAQKEELKMLLDEWKIVGKFLRVFGFDDGKIKKVVEAIYKNDKKFTIEDAINALGYPTGYLYYMADGINGIFAEKGITIPDFLAHFFIESKKFLASIKTLSEAIADNKITLVEIFEEFDAAFDTSLSVIDAMRTIFGKTMTLLLYPIVQLIPKSEKEVVSRFTDLVSLYDDILKEALPPMITSQLKDTAGPFMEIARKSIDTKELTIPEDARETFQFISTFFDNQTSLISQISDASSFQKYFSKDSLIHALMVGDLPLMKGIVVTMIGEKPTDERVKNLVNEITASLDEKERIPVGFNETVVEYLFHNGYPLRGMKVDVTFNELLKEIGFEPYDVDTIKQTIDVLISFFDKHKDAAPVIITKIKRILNEVKNIVTPDTKVSDLIKLCPFGDAVITLLECSSKLDDASINATIEQKAAYFKDFTFQGIKVLPTLDKWIELGNATLDTFLVNVITSSEEGKKSVEQVRKVIAVFNEKKEKITGNDIKNIFGKEYTDFVSALNESTRFTYYTTGQWLNLVTGIDFTPTMNTFYQITASGAQGSVKFAAIANAGNKLEDQQQELGKKYEIGNKKLSTGAIIGIVVAVLAVIAISCFAVYFFVFRKKSVDTASSSQVNLV